MEERLRKFARVVEDGGFVRAAEDLHISQPALSTAISKLERELGTDLFLRRNPPLKLAKAGELTYKYAKELDAKKSNFKQELAELSDQKPVLSIGMIDSVAHAIFVRADYLHELRQQARVSLTVNNSRLIMRALERGELDLALTTQPKKLSPTVKLTPLGNEPLIAVTSPDREAEAKKQIKKGIVPDYLGYNRESNTDRLIRDTFTRRGVEMRTIFSSTSPEILYNLVLSGEGTAVLPYLMVKDKLHQKALVPIASVIERPIISLELKGRDTAPLLKELVGNVKRVVNQLHHDAVKASARL